MKSHGEILSGVCVRVYTRVRVARSNPSCFVSLPFAYGEENTRLRAETIRLEARYRARAVWKVFYTLPVSLVKRRKKHSIDSALMHIEKEVSVTASTAKEEDLVFKLLGVSVRDASIYFSLKSFHY